MCCAIRYLDPASVRWVDDQQQEGGGSGGGDTLIMLKFVAWIVFS